MKTRTWPSLVIGALVSAVALGYLLRRDLSGIHDELRGANYWMLFPFFAVSVAGLGLRAVRWRVLLDERLALPRSFHILNVSYFINGVLPLRVGEVARAVLAARVDPPVPVLTSASTIVVERLLDTLMVFALIGLTLALIPAGLEIGVVGVLLGVGTVIGVVVLAVTAARPAWAHAALTLAGRAIPALRRPALRRWLDHLLAGITPLADPRRALALAGWTAAGWTMSVVAGYILLIAMFDEPTWAASLAMVALASFAIAVPAVPGNLGPFEAAVVFGLASAGLVSKPTDAPAVAFAILLHVLNLLTYISMGLLGLWAEGVSLGEIVRAARALRQPGEQGAAAPLAESSPPWVKS